MECVGKFAYVKFVDDWWYRLYVGVGGHGLCTHIGYLVDIMHSSQVLYHRISRKLCLKLLTVTSH